MSRIIALASGQQIALDNIDCNLPPNLIDMFSRLRVSQPVTQVVLNQSNRLTALQSSGGIVTGTGGSVTYNENESSSILAVGTTQCLVRLRTNIAGIYQTGKSLLIFFTFTLGTGVSGVNKRCGYFTPNDGVYLEQNGTTLRWCLKSSVNGGIALSTVNQVDWNTDKFDGTGSGYNFDVTQGHIGWIALEWLGMGDVFCGFVKDTVPVLAHAFRHPNLSDRPYMRSANLYPTFELEQTAVTGGNSASYRAVCATVLNEGSLDTVGLSYGIKRNTNYTTTTANEAKPILLFRLNPSYVSSRIKPLSFSVAITSNSNFYVYLCRNPSFNNAITPTWVSLANKSIQYDNTPATTLTITNIDDCNVWINSGTNNSNLSETSKELALSLGSLYDGTPEIWCLAVACEGQNETVSLASINFLEGL